MQIDVNVTYKYSGRQCLHTFSFALYPDKAAGEQADVWKTWDVCSLNPTC